MGQIKNIKLHIVTDIKVTENMAEYLLCFKTSWEPQKELPDVSIQEEIYYRKFNQVKVEDVENGGIGANETPSYPTDTKLLPACNVPECSQSSVPEVVHLHQASNKKEKLFSCSSCTNSYTTKRSLDR